MGQGLTDRFSGLSTGSGRAALATAAAAVVLVVCAVLAAAGVATGEIVATALFLPVFLAAMFVGPTVGLVAAAGATAVYALTRRADLADAGGAAVVVIAARGLAYVVVDY